MLVRRKRLPENQSPAHWDEKAMRTVHHSPPKNTAPSERPVTNANTRFRASFIGILLSFLHLLVFFIHPMPGIQAPDGQADDQQRERPGMDSGMAIVQPDTQRRTQQGRAHH